MYVASSTVLNPFALTHDPKRSTMDFVPLGGGHGDHLPQGLPLAKPPWGRITALDLNRGELVWMVPNGDTPDYVKHHPALQGVALPKTGRPGRAGVMVTKTLVFAGEGAGAFGEPRGAGGPMFRAYDKRSGAIVWEFKLPRKPERHPDDISAEWQAVHRDGCERHQPASRARRSGPALKLMPFEKSSVHVITRG